MIGNYLKVFAPVISKRISRWGVEAQVTVSNLKSFRVNLVLLRTPEILNAKPNLR